MSTEASIKQDDLDYDLGLLMATDLHPIEQSTSNAMDAILKNTATINTQYLFNQLFSLNKAEGKHIAELPAVTTRLPRQKPAPQPKPETKWEKYAKEKGIQNRKRERMVWDEDSQTWKPRWGYKGVTDTEKKDWVIEYKEGDDMSANMFEKKREEKKLRVLKNKQQMVNNKLRGSGGKIKNAPMELPSGVAESMERGKGKGRGKERTMGALKQAQLSTASMGRFDEKVQGEPKKARLGSKKRKFAAAEKTSDVDRDLKLLDRVLGKGASRSSHSHGLDLDQPTAQIGTQRRKKGKR